MGSFNKMAVFPVGYFRAFSSWLLRNRREVAGRINAITAELDRIGFVTVSYLAKKEGEDWIMTEERVGFSVTQGSSLARLCQAYIAQGGNPLDISPFMEPDSTEAVALDDEGEPITIGRYPHGGVIAPISVEANDPQPQVDGKTGYEGYRGGFLRTDRYYPARLGGRQDRGAFDSDSVVRMMHQMRSWANQGIKERVLELEARIIKLCDLREQLTTERDEMLVQAFGGVLSGVDDDDSERFANGLRVQNLVQDLYERLFETDATGSVTAYRANVKVPFLNFALKDVPSENRDPLGG